MRSCYSGMNIYYCGNATFSRPVVAMSSIWFSAQSKQALVSFVDQTVALSRAASLTYANGLQMGQAVRNILPAMCNEFVTIIKETSILGMVGIVELMFRAQSIAKQTSIFLVPYVIAALMYFIIVFPLSKIIAAVERRMSKSVTR